MGIASPNPRLPPVSARIVGTATMTVIPERSAGVIPFRLDPKGEPEYLVLHSALVRNPRAKWEFPKGTVESGETLVQAAVREFIEETGLTHHRLIDGFERSLSYTYVRKGRKIQKTVTYFLVEVLDAASLTRSAEHIEDLFGFWCFWGSFKQIHNLLYHAKIRQVFLEADQYLKWRIVSHPHQTGSEPPTPTESPDGQTAGGDPIPHAEDLPSSTGFQSLPPDSHLPPEQP